MIAQILIAQDGEDDEPAIIVEKSFNNVKAIKKSFNRSVWVIFDNGSKMLIPYVLTMKVYP